MRFAVICCLFAIGLNVFAAEGFEIVDKAEFAKVVPADAKVEKLASDMKFVEGPCWMAEDGGYLLFSDIPQNHIKKWSEKDGLSIFREDEWQCS
jgi:hypothetical protein